MEDQNPEELKLTGEDAAVFAEALVNPPEPNDALKAAVERYKARFEARSYSERHPELGKMLKCQICLTRHRSLKVCRQKFATDTHDPRPEGEKKLLVASQTTIKGVWGALGFAKKRRKPHHSHALLRLVQRTQDLFPKYYPDQINDPEKAMKAARGEALAGIRRERKAARKARS
jgi:hypothetical protein